MHLEKVLSAFPPGPLQLFLPERSTRYSGIILNNYKSDKLSSELVSPVERSPMLKISDFLDRRLMGYMHVSVHWDEGWTPLL